jgi:hypothetical protein
LALPTGWALATSTALHLALAAGACAAFARRAGLSPAAATLAGIVFATTGAMRHWQLWPYLFEASAWLPLGAIGVLDIPGNRGRRGALLLAASSGASWLAGGPQATVFSVYVWAALAFVRLLFDGTGVDRPRAVAWTVGALVAGGLLGAAALLPGYELAQEGIRATRSLSPESVYAIVASTRSDVLRGWLASEPWVLVPAFLLAPLSLLAAPRWLAAWALVVGAFALLVSFGPGTAGFHLYSILPALGWFREPTRALLVAGFCVAILAALGLDGLTRLVRIRMLGPVGVAGVVGALAFHGLRMAPPEPPLPYAAGAVPWTARQYDAYVRLSQVAGADRVWPFSPTPFADALPPKLASLTHLRSIEDYEPLPLRRQSEFFAYLVEGSTVRWDWRAKFAGRTSSLRAPPGRGSPGTRRRLLDLMATRFVLLPRSGRQRADLVAFVGDAGLRPASVRVPALEAADLELLENPHALPRAYVTYRARRAPAPRTLLSTLAAEQFDPLAESWIEADADLPAAADAPPRGVPATIVRDDPQIVEVRATLAAPGLVVLADTYARGWQATVDGVRAPILATNHLFRGVPAPAGEHVVRFEYRPRSLRIGVALTLLTASALVLVGWRTTKTRAA